MLDKKIFVEGINHLLIIFPTWKADFSEAESVRAWYGYFSHLSKDAFQTMITEYCKNETYPPTVKGLLDYSK